MARASLEELRLDYQDFLRQGGLPVWEPNHPALTRFKTRRCSSVEDVRSWVEEEKQRERHTDDHGRTRTDTDKKVDNDRSSVSVREGLCSSVSSPVLVANAVLSLLNLCCYLLDRQIAAQAKSFEKEGGFTERLYRVRSAARKR